MINYAYRLFEVCGAYAYYYVDFAAALIYHFYVDVGGGKRHKHFRRGTCLMAHTVSDYRKQGYILVNVDKVGVDSAADFFYEFELYVAD